MPANVAIRGWPELILPTASRVPLGGCFRTRTTAQVVLIGKKGVPPG